MRATTRLVRLTPSPRFEAPSSASVSYKDELYVAAVNASLGFPFPGVVCWLVQRRKLVWTLAIFICQVRQLVL